MKNSRTVFIFFFLFLFIFLTTSIAGKKVSEDLDTFKGKIGNMGISGVIIDNQHKMCFYMSLDKFKSIQFLFDMEDAQQYKLIDRKDNSMKILVKEGQEVVIEAVKLEPNKYMVKKFNLSK